MNKSGYFKDREGNKLYGATLGENVFLSDGTDLETKLNNLSLIPKISTHSGSVDLASNAYVQPFSFYAEVNLASVIGSRTVIGVLISGQSTTNPTTYTYNSGYLRIYGAKEATLNYTLVMI